MMPIFIPTGYGMDLGPLFNGILGIELAILGIFLAGWIVALVFEWNSLEWLMKAAVLMMAIVMLTVIIGGISVWLIPGLAK